MRRLSARVFTRAKSSVVRGEAVEMDELVDNGREMVDDEAEVEADEVLVNFAVNLENFEAVVDGAEERDSLSLERRASNDFAST